MVLGIVGGYDRDPTFTACVHRLKKSVLNATLEGCVPSPLGAPS